MILVLIEILVIVNLVFLYSLTFFLQYPSRHNVLWRFKLPAFLTKVARHDFTLAGLKNITCRYLTQHRFLFL